MKRIQLFEFEDFAWFPTAFRRPMTSLIAVLHRLMGTKEVLAGLISKARTKAEFEQVVDLGAGSGGIMPEVQAELAEKGASPLKFLLTDLHPNPDFVRQFNAEQPPTLRYRPESLSADQMEQAPKGLKTMVNSFHHMPPETARKILLSAQKSREPFLVYEIAHNNIPTLVWWLLLPISFTVTFLMSLFLTPFSRPITLSQIIFTYLIPVIPLCYAWDGQASLIRMYTFPDIDLLLGDDRHGDYQWEMGLARKANGKKLGTYLLGWPGPAQD